MFIFINCEVYVPSKGSLIAFQAFLQRLKKPLSGGSAIKNSAFVRTTPGLGLSNDVNNVSQNLSVASICFEKVRSLIDSEFVHPEQAVKFAVGSLV